MNRLAEEHFSPGREGGFRRDDTVWVKDGELRGSTFTAKCALFSMSERLLSRSLTIAIALSKETSAHRFFARVVARQATPFTSIN